MLLVCFSIFYVILALLMLYRVFVGPSVVDRVVAADCADILVSVALVLFSLYSGRGIYLDIALVTALLGFISNILISKYLEGKI